MFVCHVQWGGLTRGKTLHYAATYCGTLHHDVIGSPAELPSRRHCFSGGAPVRCRVLPRVRPQTVDIAFRLGGLTRGKTLQQRAIPTGDSNGRSQRAIPTGVPNGRFQRAIPTGDSTWRFRLHSKLITCCIISSMSLS